MSINQKTYEELQGYYQARNKTAIYNLASKPGHAPTVPKNVFQNNVAIKVEETWKNSSGIAFSGSGVGNAGYAARDDKLPSGESMFVDYGKDFQLTEAGLAAVREKIPDFENIDTSKIGLQPYLDNGVERYVGGRVPSASNATVSGTGETWDTVEAAYTFTDPDGDEEGVSEIVWYISSRENGTYTRLSGKQGKRLMIDPSYAEQYIRYEIKPYDSQGVYGETVTSATIRLPKADPMNTLALRTALTRARDALAKANIGSGVGQTPQSAANTLQGLIDETVILLADSEKMQAQISRQTERLEIGLIRFNNSRNVEEISLNSALADTANWKVGVGPDEIRFQDGAILLNNTSRGDYNVVYEGREYRDQVLKFKYKVDDLGDGTVGFFLRQQDKDVMPGETAAYGFMINKDNFELRSYQPDGLLTTAVRNEKTVDGETVPLFEAGKEYTMTVGAYDEGDAVRLVMKVGDDTIFDFLHESGNTAVPTTLNGLSGYLAAYTGAGLSAQLMPIAADKSQLRSAIDNATATRAGLSVGDRYAQHPQSAADEFDAILASAEAVASNIDALQETVDNMVFELNAALNDLLGNKNAVGALESGESVNYEYDIAGRSTFNIPQDAKNVYLRVDSTREHNFVVNKQIGSSQLTMTVAQGTTMSANAWDGTILLPEQLDTSSATVEGRIASVFKLGSASGINASKPVRIVLPGMASYSIGYVRNGKLTRISERLSEDSMDAAEAALTNNKPAAYMKAGNDMVVWTNQLTELVCYTAENNNTNNNGGGGNVSGPSTSGVSNSGTSSNGLLGQSNTTKFIDIIGHWAKDDIENLYAKGIVTGVTEITFEPDRSVTRAEFATLITKALNLTSDVSQGFEDVRIGEWHYSFVNAAANAGLIVGYDGYFRPDDYITREEMAVIIAKAFAYRGKTAGSGGIEKFTDKGEISDWAYSYVDSVTTAGLISGMTPTTFVAGANTTRAQSASVIRRLLDN